MPADTSTPTPPQRVVAVVVTYNRLDKLRVTLARLLAEPWSGQDAATPSRTGVRGMERLRSGGVADP